MEKTGRGNRGHAFLSASCAQLWLNCPGSALANAQYPDGESDYTREGTLAHEVAEACARARMRRSGHSALDEALNALRAKWGDSAITGEMLECGAGYAAYLEQRMRGASAALLEQKLDFSNWVPEGFGTGDAVIVGDGVLTIVDYKYGQGVAVASEGNPQMRLYALGAIHDYGMIFEFNQVRMCIYQPRMNNISEATMNVQELIDWAQKVVAPAANEAYSGEGSFHPGPHCRKFCRHAGRCPALARYMSDFVETHGVRGAVPHLSDADYLAVMQLEPLIRMWLDKVSRAALERILGGSPIPGLKVVAGRSQRKWSNESAVYAALLRLGNRAEDVLEPQRVLSVAAMEKALGRKRVSEQVGGYIVKTPGKPTLALAGDRRADYDPGADFEKLD